MASRQDLSLFFVFPFFLVNLAKAENAGSMNYEDPINFSLATSRHVLPLLLLLLFSSSLHLLLLPSIFSLPIPLNLLSPSLAADGHFHWAYPSVIRAPP